MGKELKIKKRSKPKAPQAAGKAKRGNLEIFLRTFLAGLLIFTLLLVPPSIGLNIYLEGSPFAHGDEEESFRVLIGADSPFFEEYSESKRVNVLLLGLNSGLTDTIMLASFDTQGKKVDVISVPRDTYYYRNGYNGEAEKKINAAYRKDPLNTAKAVSDILLGMPIHYYAVVEYDDICTIVDAMGGVPMYIEKDMNYEDPYDEPPLVIHIKAGQQTLDGEDSVKFLRYRKGYAEGDIGRVKAQQTWVKNAMYAALDYGVVKVSKVAFEEIESNITRKAMLYLAGKAVGMNTENINTYTIPNTPDTQAPWYVYPNTKEIETMIKGIYAPEPKSEEESTE